MPVSGPFSGTLILLKCFIPLTVTPIIIYALHVMLHQLVDRCGAIPVSGAAAANSSDNQVCAVTTVKEMRFNFRLRSQTRWNTHNDSN
jgi:hypothetical protein